MGQGRLRFYCKMSRVVKSKNICVQVTRIGDFGFPWRSLRIFEKVSNIRQQIRARGLLPTLKLPEAFIVWKVVEAHAMQLFFWKMASRLVPSCPYEDHKVCLLCNSALHLLFRFDRCCVYLVHNVVQVPTPTSYPRSTSVDAPSQPRLPPVEIMNRHAGSKYS